jgi:hypothetical protein
MKHNWLFWIPRILVILFALFTMIFSFDVFGEKAPWYTIALGFIIHNIPFIVLMLLLWISWKHPSIGSIVFFLVMIPFALIVRTFGHFMTLVYFLGPPFLIGVLFLFDYFQQMKYREEMERISTVPRPGPIEPKDIEPIDRVESDEPLEPVEPVEPIESSNEKPLEKKPEEEKPE